MKVVLLGMAMVLLEGLVVVVVVESIPAPITVVVRMVVPAVVVAITMVELHCMPNKVAPPPPLQHLWKQKQQRHFLQQKKQGVRREVVWLSKTITKP